MLIRRKTGITVLLIMLVLGMLVFFIDMRLKASILELAQAKAQIRVTELINQAVNDRIVRETEYKDIVFVHKDDAGRIVMIQANTIILNQIMAKTNTAILDGFKDGEDYVKVPLGQITGMALFSNAGPKVKVRIIPARQLHVSVKDQFEQAGINQTRHSIYLEVNSRIKMAVPLMGKDFNVISTIPIAETIIVGDVPNTYVNLSGDSGSLYPLLKNRNGE